MKKEGNEIPLQPPILTFQNRGVGGLHVPLAVVSTTLPTHPGVFLRRPVEPASPVCSLQGPGHMTGRPERSLALEEKDLER